MRVVYLAVALAVFSTNSAGALTLIGDLVDFDFQSPDVPLSAQNVLVIDPGDEFAIQLIGTDFLQVDLSANTITLSAVDTGYFFDSEVLLISDLDWVDFPSGQITGASAQGSFSGGCLPPFGCGAGGQPSVTLPDGHTVRIAFDANSPANLGFTSGDVVTIALIPEPSTALLLATGLAGLAAAKRRRSLH